MKNIKLIALDVDGVLTDGKLLIGPNCTEYKSFHVKDGMGINLARYFGLKVAFITGRHSEAVRIRAKELEVDFVYEGISNKAKILEEIVEELKIKLEDVFYMGDDINDIPIIKLVGYSAAPSDAIELVRNEVDFVTHHSSGNGAVREAIETIFLKAEFRLEVDEFLKKNRQ